MIPRALCLCGVAAMLLVGSSQLDAKQLYKWTDEKGVVHYTDVKPEGVDFEHREIVPDPAPAQPAATGSEATAEGSDGEANTADPRTAGPTSAGCLQVRSNIETLTSAPEVSMDLDGDGKPELLDRAGRARAIAQSREREKELCGP